MSAMQPLQSMVGMFANPGALGMGGAAPGASAASAAGGISAAATEVGAGGGGAALGGGGMPATSFTRPVSAFESGTSGRPVGLRPSGALGADVVRAPTTTVGGRWPQVSAQPILDRACLLTLAAPMPPRAPLLWSRTRPTRGPANPRTGRADWRVRQRHPGSWHRTR